VDNNVDKCGKIKCSTLKGKVKNSLNFVGFLEKQ
jgi:hypothetical protein